MSEDKALLTEALELFKYSYEYWEKNYEDRFRQCYKAFKRIMDKDNYPLYHKRFRPKIYSNIMEFTSRAIESIFASRDLVSFIPTPEAPLEDCKKVEYRYNSMLQRNKFYWCLYSMIQQAAIYGVGFCKILWDTKNNYSIADPVSSLEFFYDPACGWSLDKAEYYFQRKIMTVHQVKEIIKAGHWREVSFKKIPIGAVGNREEVTDFLKQDKSGLSDRLKTVEILEGCVGDKELTIIGRDQFLSIREKGEEGSPFIMLQFSPVVEEPVGEGIAFPNLDAQMSINDWSNLTDDLGMKVVQPGLKLIGGGSVEDDDLVWTPEGTIVRLSIGSDIQPLVVPDTSGIARLRQSQENDEIDRTMGVPPILRGESEGSSESATSVNIRASGGIKRTGLETRSIAQTIEDVVNRAILLDRKYMKPVKWLDRDTGELQMLRRKDILPGKYDFIPVSNFLAVQEVYRQQLMMIYERFKGDADINETEFKKIILTAFNIVEANKILNPLTNTGESGIISEGEGGSMPPGKIPTDKMTSSSKILKEIQRGLLGE